MQKILITSTLISLLLILTSSALKEKKDYRVVFYNVENLFDALDNPVKNDDEFTPSGEMHWTKKRITRKLNLLYKVFIAAGKGELPDIIGLAEIENLWVLEYLLKTTPMSNVPYGIVHKESPDPRGIDVALLYRKDRVSPVDMDFISVVKEGNGRFQSRDILHFCCQIDGETLYFYVNHWPSRYGGYNKTKAKRNLAADILRRDIANRLISRPEAKVLIMGDFNATYREECLSEILHAGLYREDRNRNGLVLLSNLLVESGPGTIRSRGKWEIFDHFICSESFLSGEGLKIDPDNTFICNDEFLLEPDRRYLGFKPFRTYLGPVYHGGISDHLPIVAVLRD